MLVAGFSAKAEPGETSAAIAQSEPKTQVFRAVGADGVVEFNDYGEGEPVNVVVAEPVSEADVSIVRERQRDILEVAQLLSSDRSDRRQSRLDERERARAAQAQFEQQELAVFRAADSAFFPARRFGFSPFAANRFFANGRRRNQPRFIYRPGPDHPSNGLRHPGSRPPPAAPPKQRRSIQPRFGQR